MLSTIPQMLYQLLLKPIKGYEFISTKEIYVLPVNSDIVTMFILMP